MHVCCTSWWSIKTGSLTLTLTNRAEWSLSPGGGWKAILIPLGAIAHFLPRHAMSPPGLCLHTPLSPPDKTEPFILVTWHKSSHQLKAHYWSPDPSITEGGRETDEQPSYRCVSSFSRKKRMIDFLPTAVMWIRHQSFKYSLLQGCINTVGHELKKEFLLIIKSHLDLNYNQMCWNKVLDVKTF